MLASLLGPFLFRFLLMCSISLMRYSSLSVTLHSSRTAPTFSMKMRSCNMHINNHMDCKIQNLGNLLHSCNPHCIKFSISFFKAKFYFTHFVDDHEVINLLAVGQDDIASLPHSIWQDLRDLLGQDTCVQPLFIRQACILCKVLLVLVIIHLEGRNVFQLLFRVQLQQRRGTR